ncbi:MAG: tRNA 2-selenouridine(34) synthase MnmH [Verrucomicrobiales bacterium]
MLPGIERLTFPLPDDCTFDEIIDVRTPDEFEEDHVSGAINLPVLSNEERVIVGTQYKNESRFNASKSGAALIYKNLADHLSTHFANKPKNYRPLVYCWRGGQRSESLATVLRAISWNVSMLDRGYKSYRTHVIEFTEQRSSELTFRIINSLTGCGKTKLLFALRDQGAQVLDLEGLANHKGSVFGGDPENPQPAQKKFESLIYDQLSTFDSAKTIWVEAESSKIGRLNLPVPLWMKMRESSVTKLESTIEARTEFLRDDYESWLSNQDRVTTTIDLLKSFHSVETIAEWKEWAENGEWKSLIAALLEKHYDRNYNPGGSGHYNVPDDDYVLPNQSDTAFEKCAADLIAR